MSGWPADKPLPQNPDAERAVLAAPMLDPNSNCLLAISQQ